MPIFLMKTLLGLLLLVLTGAALFTMFEVLGRTEKRADAERLKRIHRINGRGYLVLSLFIAGLCLCVVIQMEGDLSPRAALHSAFALAALLILLIKISFVRRYRQWYSRVPTMGMTLVVLTVLSFGMSGGYYLLADGREQKEGIDLSAGAGQAGQGSSAVPADPEAVRRGAELYKAKCAGCHDPNSTATLVGPGHKGILKRPTLPVSKRPATPENVVRQLRNPYRDMPPFTQLTDEQVRDLLAYLNTL